jgi:nickel-dependent lactate racemase
LVEIWLPYGASEIPASLPAERLVDVLRQESPPTTHDYLADARKALESNEALATVLRESKQTCLVLGSCGNQELTVALSRLILGFLAERSNSPILLLRTHDAAKLDHSSFAQAQVIDHNPISSPCTEISTNATFPVQLNSAFVNANLRIVVGELKPHHLLKFEGLTDTVLLGLASERTIKSHLTDRTGLTLDDLYKERVEVSNSIDNLFAFGYVLADGLNPAEIKCGTLNQTLGDLEKAVQAAFTKSFSKKADIVVIGAGGKPTDETLSRAVETLPVGLSALKKNGSMIIAAECENGHGNGEFYDWCAEGKEARYLEARIHRRLNYDGFKAALLRRSLDAHRMYLVSTLPDHYVESVFKMRASRSINAALQTLQRVQGSDATVTVIPNASRVIAKLIEGQKSEPTHSLEKPQ